MTGDAKADRPDPVIQETYTALAELTRIAQAIRGYCPPSNPHDLRDYLKEPAVRALTILSSTHLVILANIEIFLMKICGLMPLDHARWVSEFRPLGEGKEGYWSKGAIAEGVTDLALKLEVLKPDDVRRLRAKHAWEDGQFRIDDASTQLEEEIPFLEELVRRLVDRLPTTLS